METAYFYLGISGIFTLLLWAPYILARAFTWGIPAFLHSYPEQPPEQPQWAQRAQRVHLNMVETLPAFAAVILAAGALAPQAAEPDIALWAQVFFAARVVHALVFTLGIPYLRTPTYLVSWFATLMIGVMII